VSKSLFFSKKRKYFLCGFLLVSGFALIASRFAASKAPSARSGSLHSSEPGRAMVQRQLAMLPVAFEPNDGQAEAAVKYIARGRGYKLYLTSSEAVFSLRGARTRSAAQQMVEHKRLGPRRVKDLARQRTGTQEQMDFASIHIHLLGGDPLAGMAALEPQSGKVNYFIGNDSSKWHSDIPLFARVVYEKIYPGIDLAFAGGSQLEFAYVVNPNADPRSIALGITGAEKIKTTDAGDLVLGTSSGPVQMHRPIAYQEQNGVRELVPAQFEVTDSGKVSFNLGSYDHSRQLVIDPTITYSTYFGGDGADYGLSIAADGSGNAYVAGSSSSLTIPGPGGSVSNPNSMGSDVFVTEINPAGAVVFTTFFGGTGTAGNADNFPGFPNALAVDASGIYVAGTTDSSSFPVTSGAADGTFQGGTVNGNNDAFAVKLSSSGSLAWGTYIGGNDSDSGLGLAIDKSDNVYVVGETYSTNLPVKNALPGGSALNLGKGTGDDDGYIVALNSSGSAFSLVSYIGGSSGDIATAVSLDSSANVYVSGSTISSDLPVTSGVVQSTYNSSGDDDMFVCSIASASFTATNRGNEAAAVAKLSPPGQRPIFFTSLVFFPALALFGSVWISSSSRRRKTLGISVLCLGLLAFLMMPACGGGSGSNNNTGGNGGTGGGPTSSFVYLTYYGGSGDDDAIGIVADASGDAFVTGETTSTDFPVSSPTYQANLAGSQNALLVELNPSGTKASYSTYFVGNGTEFGYGVALDNTGNVYLTGQTNSTNFPAFAPTQGTFGGSTDAYVSVLSPSSNSLLFSTYLGGGGDEDQLAGSIAVSTIGSFFVTGDTDSGSGTTSPFPTVSPIDGAWGGGSCTDPNNNPVPCPNGFVTAYSTL